MADNAALSSAADTEWIALGQFSDTTFHSKVTQRYSAANPTQATWIHCGCSPTRVVCASTSSFLPKRT